MRYDSDLSPIIGISGSIAENVQLDSSEDGISWVKLLSPPPIYKNIESEAIHACGMIWAYQ